MAKALGGGPVTSLCPADSPDIEEDVRRKRRKKSFSRRKRQKSFAGPAAEAAAWLKSYADAGATHLVLRFAGDHDRHLETAARIRRDLGW